VADFDKAIPPGGEGKITLKIKTEGYQGTIRKSARVYSNDPARGTVRLNISAFVKTPIHLSPRYVHLYAKDEKSVTKVVEVRAELDKPLKLTPDKFNLADKVTYTLEEVEAGRKFQIQFTSLPGLDKAYRGSLTLKTNYPEKPEITLRIRGSVKRKHQHRPKETSPKTSETP
jgi:hypothetical protein